MNEVDVTAIKDAARHAIEAERAHLLDLSHSIHEFSEPAFEETRSASLLAEYLRSRGIDVTLGIGELPTALEGRVGDGDLVIAVCAEYDALPEVGHACGHNVIAGSAAGAVIGLRDVASSIGLTVRLVGTPAEEIGDLGGKERLLDHGVFEDVHAALMVHPGATDVLTYPFYAIATFDVVFTGREAHAAAYPELGVNAADALIVAQTAIGLLRQQLPRTVLVHGVTTLGGAAPNIIPGEARARFMVRAPALTELEDAKRRVLDCFRGAAIATGTTLAVVGGDHPYAEVRHDGPIARLFAANWQSLGRSFADGAGIRPGASTDMGNVSQCRPAIHPLLSIDPPSGVVNHQPAFAAASVAPAADRVLIDGAIALAWTAIDLATRPDDRRRLVAGDTDSEV